jgi:hypothetical protein
MKTLNPPSGIPRFLSSGISQESGMRELIEYQKTVLFDDKSAVEAFIKNGWLEKVKNGKTPDEILCRYTPKGMEFRRIISRFEAN